MLRGLKPFVRGHTTSPVVDLGFKTVRSRKGTSEPVMFSSRWREDDSKMDRTRRTRVG